MAQRIRTQRNRDASSGNGGSSSSVSTSSRDHPPVAAASAAAASGGGGGAGSKRKRDVLQDISEEHGGNGEAGRHQQHASATSSRRSQQAPRRPSPMAPARRASVRRSRRLSEQQPSATSGRGGALARAAASSAAGNSGAGGAGAAGAAGRGDGEREGGGDDDDEGGMSCDEDLEGTVVDLSFEGVADDSVWREADVAASAAASSSSGSASRRSPAPSHGGRGLGGASGGGSPTSSRSRNSSSSSDRGAGGAGVSTEGGGGGSEAESGVSIGSSNSRSSSGAGAGAGSDADRRTRRVRSRLCASREKERQASSAAAAPTAADDLRKSESAAADARALRDTAAARGSGLARGRRAKRASSFFVTEGEPNLSTTGKSGGHSAHPQASHTPPPCSTRAPAGHKTERGVASAGVAAAGGGVEAGVRTPLPAGVEDMDAGVWDEGDSHLLNPDYVAEHAAFLRVQEKRNRPSAYIGVRQKDMRSSMRSVLVDWIVEVCDQFKVSSRTLFQVVDLIDRSLTAFEVPRGRLQLLGCACVVLASKYEEIYAPAAQELAHISDNTYTRAEIISMELLVVNALQFRLSCVTPCNFQDRFCRAARSNPRERSLVAYLLELLLQDYQGVTLLPSLKAAAALYLARQTLHPPGCGRVAWTKQTEYYTGYTPRALEACVRRLHTLHVRAEGNSLHAVREKYTKQARHCAAEVTCALEDSLRFGDEGA